MRTLDEVKGACRIDDDGCWIWGAGQTGENKPRINAPDWTNGNGAMKAQDGRRGVWHIATGLALPPGWLAYGTCGKPLCMNPKCVEAGPRARYGKVIAESGRLKGSIARCVQSRKVGRARSKLSPERIAEINGSDEPGYVIAARLFVSQSTISRVRRGTHRAFEAIGSPFAGLGSRG